MDRYTVTLTVTDAERWFFECSADSPDHAIEQAKDSDASATVVSVYKQEDVTELMCSPFTGVKGFVHRQQRVPPDRESMINSWRQYLQDLEDEGHLVRAALCHNFTDQRIDMEIAATVKNLQTIWPDCADYGHDEIKDDVFHIFDKDDKVIGEISDSDLLRYHLVSMDETGIGSDA